MVASSRTQNVLELDVREMIGKAQSAARNPDYQPLGSPDGLIGEQKVPLRQSHHRRTVAVTGHGPTSFHSCKSRKPCSACTALFCLFAASASTVRQKHHGTTFRLERIVHGECIWCRQHAEINSIGQLHRFIGQLRHAIPADTDNNHIHV